MFSWIPGRFSVASAIRVAVIILAKAKLIRGRCYAFNYTRPFVGSKRIAQYRYDSDLRKAVTGVFFSYSLISDCVGSRRSARYRY